MSTDKVDEMNDFYLNVMKLKTETEGLPVLVKKKGYSGEVEFVTDGNIQTHLAEKDLDVNFKTLIRDPCRTVENIYQHFNLPVPNSLKGSVHRYLQEHPKDEYGTHQYSLERYGLCRRELHREYRDYIDYYQVPLEADS